MKYIRGLVDEKHRKYIEEDYGENAHEQIAYVSLHSHCVDTEDWELFHSVYGPFDPDFSDIPGWSKQEAEFDELFKRTDVDHRYGPNKAGNQQTLGHYIIKPHTKLCLN